jgi:ABC-type transporter Mla MlaB component
MTLRIRRLAGTQGITFALSGELDSDQLAELDGMMERDKAGGLVLDLTDVTLATREGIAFIQRAVAAGAELVNCPPYIRRWIGETENE